MAIEEEAPSDFVDLLLKAEIPGVKRTNGILQVKVVDLAWGPWRDWFTLSCELKTLLDDLSVTFQRPKKGSCRLRQSMTSVVRSYLANHLEGELLILLLGRSHRQWKEFNALAFQETETVSQPVIALQLSQSAQKDTSQALGEMSERIKLMASGGQVEDPEATSTAIVDRVRQKTGLNEPLVLVVCGNETQARAQTEFPAKLRAELGLDGRWLLTDYDRPERVVNRIKEIVEAELEGDRSRVFLVLFSQRFNATNVKRDGQAYLRDVGVLSLTPRIKSTGSALAQVTLALESFVSDRDGNANTE